MSEPWTLWSDRDKGYCLFFVVETIGLFLLFGMSSVPSRILGGIVIVAAWLPVILGPIAEVKERDRLSYPRRRRENDDEKRS